MKFLIMLVLTTSLAFAEQAVTDCQAMNHSREKIVKDGSVKKVRSGSRVVSQ